MFTHPSFLWGIAGIILIAAEMFIPGFTVFFFGAGALLTAVIAAILPPVADSLVIQIVLWAASSILSFSFLRRRFRKIFKGTLLDKPRNEGIGETATVLEAITPDNPGRVRFRGTSWQAVSLSESFKTGDMVEIIESSGLTLTVTAPFDRNDKDGGDDFMKRLRNKE